MTYHIYVTDEDDQLMMIVDYPNKYQKQLSEVYNKNWDISGFIDPLNLTLKDREMFRMLYGEGYMNAVERILSKARISGFVVSGDLIWSKWRWL